MSDTGPRLLEETPVSARLCVTSFALLAALSCSSAASAAIEVNTCGQEYTGDGYLSGNLDCSLHGGNAVTIQGGSLDLAGFTLTGRVVGYGFGCAVVSTGARGSVVDGYIHAFPPPFSPRIAELRVENVNVVRGDIYVTGSATLLDVVIEDSPTRGVYAWAQYSEIHGYTGGNLKIERSEIRGSASTAALASRRLSIEDSEISMNFGGLVADNVEVTRCNVVDNLSTGISAGTYAGSNRVLKVTDSTVDRNEIGTAVHGGKAQIEASSVSANLANGIYHAGKGTKVVDSIVSGNGANGIAGLKNVKVQGSTIQDNGESGISLSNTTEERSRLSVRDSTLSGNSTSMACGVETVCADLVTKDEPRVVRTTCETSSQLGSDPAADWDVCSLD
jgi:hypothetical protein